MAQCRSLSLAAPRTGSGPFTTSFYPFMSNSCSFTDTADCTGFRLVDLNKDGTKELLTTYDGYGKNVYHIYVYAYKKKKSNKKFRMLPILEEKRISRAEPGISLCNMLYGFGWFYTVLVVTMRESPLVVLEPPKMVTTARYWLPEEPW